MFKRKQYTYHVAYTFPMGIGSITIYRSKKINTANDVGLVKSYIEENYNQKDVVITNWIRLKNSHIPSE